MLKLKIDFELLAKKIVRLIGIRCHIIKLFDKFLYFVTYRDIYLGPCCGDSLFFFMNRAVSVVDL
jgi:hypothetical protein